MFELRRRGDATARGALLCGLLLALACTNNAAAPEVAEPEERPPSVQTVTDTKAPDATPSVQSDFMKTEPGPPPVPVPTVEASANPHAADAFPGSAAALEGDRIVPKTLIAYATGKETLLPPSKSAFNEVKLLLESKPAITLVRVEVHTDSMGSDTMNLALSKRRALAVARGLVSVGVPCKKLIAVGFGESKPIASNDTAESRAKNRRTEFVVTGLRNKLIGGAPADGGGDEAGDPCS